MPYRKRDIVVGAFIVLSVVILAGLTALKAGFDIGYYHIYAEFDAIQGISEGSKVRVRGVEIGQVRKIVFDPAPQREGAYIRLLLAVDERYPLYKGTVARVYSSTPLSGYFVRLDLDAADPARPLASGDTIQGRSAHEMDQIVVRLEGILDKVDGIAQKVLEVEDQILALNIPQKGEILFGQTSQVVADVDSLVISSNTTMVTLNAMLKENRGQIRQIASQTDAALLGLQTLLGTADSTLSTTHRLLASNLEQTHRLLARLDTTIYQNQDHLAQIMENLRATSGSLRDIAQHPYKLLTGDVK